MFRTATCPSTGELIVSIRHLVYITLYILPFGVQVWMRQLIKLFSWWWAHDFPKHVENRKKHTWKRTVRQVGYLQRLSGSNFAVNCMGLWLSSGKGRGRPTDYLSFFHFRRSNSRYKHNALRNAGTQVYREKKYLENCTSNFTFKMNEWMNSSNTYERSIITQCHNPQGKIKVNCTLVQAPRLCTGRAVHRGSRGVALLYRHWGSVQAVRSIGGVEV
jgi:hypothetical protein